MSLFTVANAPTLRTAVPHADSTDDHLDVYRYQRQAQQQQVTIARLRTTVAEQDAEIEELRDRVYRLRNLVNGWETTGDPVAFRDELWEVIR